MTSLYDLIRSKRDTRLYADRPISDETLHRILQAGRMAGSARHSQPVRFIAVQDPAQIQALAACGNSTRQFQTAPLLVALVLLPDQGQFDPVRASSFDAGRAAQNMMLTAWSEGISSCPTTMHHGDDAARVLGLPDEHMIEWVLSFGYPLPDTGGGPGGSRLPFEQMVYRDRWGG
jgi:nitroreductase